MKLWENMLENCQELLPNLTIIVLISCFNLYININYVNYYRVLQLNVISWTREI